MLLNEGLRNGNLKTDHDRETIAESVDHLSQCQKKYYSEQLKQQDTRDAIDIISDTDSISIESNSYEMIE